MIAAATPDPPLGATLLSQVFPLNGQLTPDSCPPSLSGDLLCDVEAKPNDGVVKPPNDPLADSFPHPTIGSLLFLHMLMLKTHPLHKRRGSASSWPFCVCCAQNKKDDQRRHPACFHSTCLIFTVNCH